MKTALLSYKPPPTSSAQPRRLSLDIEGLHLGFINLSPGRPATLVLTPSAQQIFKAAFGGMDPTVQPNLENILFTVHKKHDGFDLSVEQAKNYVNISSTTWYGDMIVVDYLGQYVSHTHFSVAEYRLELRDKDRKEDGTREAHILGEEEEDDMQEGRALDTSDLGSQNREFASTDKINPSKDNPQIFIYTYLEEPDDDINLQPIISPALKKHHGARRFGRDPGASITTRTFQRHSRELLPKIEGDHFMDSLTASLLELKGERSAEECLIEKVRLMEERLEMREGRLRKVLLGLRASLPPGLGYYKMKIRQGLSVFKRTASRFEDTMWRIKYMVSRLEFSMMIAPRKENEVFTTRVSWKCACNAVIFDDFLELAPGRSESAIPSNSGVQQHSNTSNARGSFLGSLLPTLTKWSFGGKGFSLRPSGALPSLAAQASNSSSSAQTNNHANKDIYLLLCYNNRWDSIRLLHLDIPPSKKDQELFANIRHAYYTARGWWRCLFSLKVLRHIEFVKFELYYVEDVDISARNDLPGPTVKHYEYLPRPAETIPPVGPNAFMHFFHNPEHAPTLDHLINRMPKKVDGRAKIEADASTEFGWGIHFIERFSRIRIFILASFLLFICFLFGILWTVIRNDIQGGFGVAGFLAAALAVFISIMCVQIVVY